jgi:hypothetical protein
MVCTGKVCSGRVNEDVNKIHNFPHLAMLSYMNLLVVHQSEVSIAEHLFGFVSTVELEGHDGLFVLNKIVGPDQVEEFLYQIQTLHTLQGDSKIVQPHGGVMRCENEQVERLLVVHAAKGALVDLLYNSKFLGPELPGHAACVGRSKQPEL